MKKKLSRLLSRREGVSRMRRRLEISMFFESLVYTSRELVNSADL